MHWVPAGMAQPTLIELATNLLNSMDRSVSSISNCKSLLQEKFSNEIAAGTVNPNVSDAIIQLRDLHNEAQRGVFLANDLWNAVPQSPDILLELRNIKSNTDRLAQQSQRIYNNAIRLHEHTNNIMNNLPPLPPLQLLLGVKNRPKSKITCKKRHMKWNSSTKRCNKKSKSKK